jgi:glycosyltransferase involved in cell wall biosynthesis
LRQADRFIVLSSSVGEDLLRIIPGADYRVVHHPVYDVYGPARSRSSVQRALGVEDKKVLLFFGLVRNYKGLDLLLRALPEICASVPAHLFIVGEFYEPENTYRDIIRSLGLGDDVTIVNRFVPDDEVGTYFSAADVVVLPYRAATQSGVVQIAMHFDRACIVTDTGGLAEMVADGETGFVIPVDDTTSLAESVIRFFKGSHQSSFEAAVRENKGRYSWNSLARAIEEIASTAPAR